MNSELQHTHTSLGQPCQEPCTCDDFSLSEDDLLGDAALPLVQLLTNAGDDAEPVLQSVGRLLADELISHMQNIYLIRTCTPAVKGGFFFYIVLTHKDKNTKQR